MGFLKNLFDSTKKELKYAKMVAKEVFLLEDEYKKLTDEDIKNKTIQFRARYKEGETLDDLMVEAFALVREASKRVTGLVPYFVQVCGAVAIHDGNVAEMKTGEGKTLTAVMPAYLNSLSGDAVHIVTVNEYLASREAEGEIGQLFSFLGLSVGLNLRDLTSEQKKEAYECDILYSTNSELGFDYLRDHMVLYAKDITQKRGLSYAIIDEADSILIDESRTPLIISGGEKSNQDTYQAADRFVKSLNQNDYLIDIEAKTIELSESGIDKAEKIFKFENLYDLANVGIVHHINNALRSNYIMARDKDYVVEDNQVLIVDQFTGRILHGRQFSEGLHQALEAKENVIVKKETVTVATITYQNFFRMYKKLSGMTGTAKTEEEEFNNIYNMNVIVIPTNAPVIRKDDKDFLFVTAEEKFNALVEEIEKRHNTGQPLLVGTIAVETSEYLSGLLRKKHIPHEILNAKNHEREAEIIAKAGHKGSVTIATNMAGRGTDIKLGAGVVELGGLCVLGSERHEARRIDNQLRGRAGRQGDPGYSRFFLSGDDELLVRFGGERFKNQLDLLSRINGAGKPIESKIISNLVTGAQKRIEGNNFDLRKNVLKYDDVLRKQREIIYKERTNCLILPSVEENVLKWINDTIVNDVKPYIKHIKGNEYDIDDNGIIAHFDGDIFNKGTLKKENLEKLDENEIVEYLHNLVIAEVNHKKAQTPEEVYNEFLKVVMLRVIDTYWMKHIDTMSELRQGVVLQQYGQANPLLIYQKEGLRLFNEMIEGMARDVTRYVVRAVIQVNIQRKEVVKNTATNQGTENTSSKQKNHKPPKYQKAPWHR
ncbi:MAG: preprotein translocase subunit SecA [Acholeplasmatales bacterium]|jgi:preprotein translocase subunit SecA|nr:preprotein translocase subunit SecA [Acholeplasmatales bacterium]